jgi:NADPH:quinone reductase-like Zn-dependent oxidoreductase
MNSAVLVKNKEVGFAKVPVPVPGPHQVLIKVEAAALNPSDILFMEGHYNIKVKYPYTPGWEGSGVVVAAGAGVYAEWLVGRKVAFMKAFELGAYQFGGSFAEYIVSDLKGCIPLSQDFSLE